MPNNDEQITKAINKQFVVKADAWRAACVDCGGTGIINNTDDCLFVDCIKFACCISSVPVSFDECPAQTYCPTCTPEYNALMKRAGEFVWHKIHPTTGLCICSIKAINAWTKEHPCFNKHNPTYDIPALVAILEELGLWKEFVRYCGMSTIIKKTERKPCPVNGEVDWTTFNYANMQLKFADVLTNPTRFKQALVAFLEV